MSTVRSIQTANRFNLAMKESAYTSLAVEELKELETEHLNYDVL